MLAAHRVATCCCGLTKAIETRTQARYVAAKSVTFLSDSRELNCSLVIGLGTQALNFVSR